jgi:hypothetical protein
VWELGPGGKLDELRRVDLGGTHVESIALSPDGTILAVSRQLATGDGCVELWAAGDP